ncbi:MAG: mechanosensitive ion channel family protein [Acholeplasmataceae bacterium]
MFMLYFTTLESTLWTLGIIIGIGTFFYIEKRLMNSFVETMRQWVVGLIYLVSFALFLGGIIAILWAWNIEIITYLNTIWANIIAAIESSIGAVIGSLFIVFISLLIFRISKMIFKRVESKEGPNQKRKKTIAKVTTSIIKYIVGIFAILAILALWGVNVLPALAGLGILGLIIGLGAQKFINDLISGFFIIFEHHFDVGDIIEAQGFKGEVIDIGLKTTKIRNFKGEVKILANGQIDSLVNYSQKFSLALVEFGIAYKENIQQTIDLLNEELPKFAETLPDIIEPPVILGVTELANSSVNIRVMARTLTEKHYGIERKFRQRIKELLDEHGIEIPFPQVVVHQPVKK